VKRVEVVWIDSIGLNDGGWAEREEHEEWLDAEKVLIHSCGYLYAENEDLIMLAGSENEAIGIAADVMVIPRVAIRRLTELAEPPTKKG